MQRNTLTIRKVLTMGVIIGICVIAIAYFIIYMQHRRVLDASKEGTLPKTKELINLQSYTADNEGNHFYDLEQKTEISQENIRAWSRLIYTQEGKNNYIKKRMQRNIFVEGFDQLTQRDILYEFRCNKNPTEYAIIEVFEVDGQGKTLDYGKTGSSKDWEAIPPGTTIEKLAQTVCPSIKK